MLSPVVISEVGETLVGYPANRQGVVTDQEDHSTLSISVHGICNGFTDRKNISSTHDAIVCRSCFLRVVIPKSVITYNDLRSHFSRWN